MRYRRVIRLPSRGEGGATDALGLSVVPVVFLFFFHVAILVVISHKYDLSLLSRQEVLIIPGTEFSGQERIVTCEPPSSYINSLSNMFLHLEFLV